jgi:hypothetical protein
MQPVLDGYPPVGTFEHVLGAKLQPRNGEAIRLLVAHAACGQNLDHCGRSLASVENDIAYRSVDPHLGCGVRDVVRNVLDHTAVASVARAGTGDARPRSRSSLPLLEDLE